MLDELDKQVIDIYISSDNWLRLEIERYLCYGYDWKSNVSYVMVNIGNCMLGIIGNQMLAMLWLWLEI